MDRARKLRILLAGDLHNSDRGHAWLLRLISRHEPDLLLFVGDFVTGGPLEYAREMLRELRELSCDCFVVPGNWDPRELLVYLDEESYDGLRNLHKVSAWNRGYSFVGLGGSISTPSGKSPLESPDAGFADPLAALLPADVWVLHNPLYGLRDDVVGKGSAGSHSLRALWEAADPQPLLVVSGHLHDAFGIEHEGPTTFVNAGALSDLRAALIKLHGDKVHAELLHRSG